MKQLMEDTAVVKLSNLEIEDTRLQAAHQK